MVGVILQQRVSSVHTGKLRKSPNASLSFFPNPCLYHSLPTSSVDSEVLSGAGRPVGGAGPEGDPVLCCLQLFRHCSVDQRWPGTGHWRGPAGWDITQPPQAFFSVFSMWLRLDFLGADSDIFGLELLTGKILCCIFKTVEVEMLPWSSNWNSVEAKHEIVQFK